MFYNFGDKFKTRGELVMNKNYGHNGSIKNIYLFFILFILFFTETTNPAILEKKDPKENTEKIYKNPFHENMWGVYIQKKQPFKSFQIFANLTKTNKYAYKWMINFLHKTGNNQKIAALVPLIKSAFPELNLVFTWRSKH